MMYVNEIKKGYAIKLDGEIYIVIDVEWNTPGNWRAMVMMKLKNFQTGAVLEKRFRSDGKVEDVFLEKRQMEYLYPDGEQLVFMDNETYDQILLSKEFVGDGINYLKANTQVIVQFHEGKPLGIDLPVSVDLEIVETDPSIKGATATNQYKSATLETGLKINVPPFIEQGTVVKVDTRSGEYQGRSN